MVSRLETLEHILNTMKDAMCDRIERHCVPNKEIEDWIITPDMDDETQTSLMMDMFEAEKYLAEHGCTICKVGETYRLTDCDTGHTAAGCTIDIIDCVHQGGRRVGTFHTHPTGLPIPSHDDLLCGFNWKTSYDFIGGKVGGRDVIVGYTPRPTSEMRYGHLAAMSIFRPGGTVWGDMPGEPIGVIRFYRENPGPMVSELLKDFDYIFSSDMYDEDERAEFREELESGEIPDVFWDNYESEGEVDELLVYSEDVQREGFKEQVSHFSNIFDVIVRWC